MVELTNSQHCFRYITQSWWARWRLKSPAPRLFTQPFTQAQIRENIKALRHWRLCGEFTGDRWIPRTNGQYRGKCFHLMTSTWMASPRTEDGSLLSSSYTCYYAQFVNSWPVTPYCVMSSLITIMSCCLTIPSHDVHQCLIGYTAMHVNEVL